jgi:hypothetical protein
LPLPLNPQTARQRRQPQRTRRAQRKPKPFFPKNQPLPSFAFLASFAVQVSAFAIAFAIAVAVAVAVYFAFRIPHFAFCRT